MKKKVGTFFTIAFSIALLVRACTTIRDATSDLQHHSPASLVTTIETQDAFVTSSELTLLEW